jgi:chromosome partitioning protein
MPSHPASERRPRVVAIANQKGGVGKTTTAVSLSACLAEREVRVLVVDLDPQGNATTGLGVDRGAFRLTTYDVLMGGSDLAGAIVGTGVDGLVAVPSTIDLAGAEVELVTQLDRESRLARALSGAIDRFDVVILDCPPSLGLLTVNALAAAEELLIPIQCEYYALEGLGLLLSNTSLIRENVNPRLDLAGILLTMFDPRVRLAEQVVADVREHFGSVVFETVVPRAIRLAEAPGFGMPITMYDPGSKAASAYRSVADEFLKRGRPRLGRAGALAERTVTARVHDEPVGHDGGAGSPAAGIVDVREDAMTAMPTDSVTPGRTS